MSFADQLKQETGEGWQERLVRRELVWHPGPAQGGGETPKSGHSLIGRTPQRRHRRRRHEKSWINRKKPRRRKPPKQRTSRWLIYRALFGIFLVLSRLAGGVVGDALRCSRHHPATAIPAWPARRAGRSLWGRSASRPRSRSTIEDRGIIVSRTPKVKDRPTLTLTKHGNACTT